MKSIFYIHLLYLFLIFVIFCIPTSGVYATNCPAGSNDSSTHFDLSGLTCTLANTVDGPADGDVILNTSSSLTLLEGQALIFPSGKKITIGGGTINLSKTGLGAKIIKGVMCLTDADGDFYPASNAISDRTRGPCTDTKKSIADIKAQNPTVTADCNDLSYSAINTCCIANGDACSSDGGCCNSICGTDADSDLLFSAAAAHTGTCQTTAYAYTDTNDSQYCPSGYNPAGTCDKCVNGAIANQTGSEDVNSDCAASYNACSGNNRIGPDGYCSGTGTSCKTTGLSDLCATRSTCQTGGGCSGGSCIAVTNQSYGQDLYGECTASYNACSGNNRIGPDGNCDGSGACNTGGLSSACATRSTCQTGGGCSGGSCLTVTTQTSSQDLYGECTASYNACSGNNRIGPDGYCSGTGASCKTTGLSDLCATRSTCQTGGGCSGGSCVAVTNQTSAQDLYSECAGLDCDGGATKYYSGWASNVCYYKLDVSAANHVCNGAGACKTAAVQCAASSQGASTGVTRTLCKSQVGCTGTTAGSLGNVANGSDTYSECAAPGVGTECATGNCNGAGACGAIDATFEGSTCAVCKMCGGGTACVNISNGLQDTAGVNTCTTLHYRCNGSGACTAPTAQACANPQSGWGQNCNEACPYRGYPGCVRGHADDVYNCNGGYILDCSQATVPGQPDNGSTSCDCWYYVY